MVFPSHKARRAGSIAHLTFLWGNQTGNLGGHHALSLLIEPYVVGAGNLNLLRNDLDRDVRICPNRSE